MKRLIIKNKIFHNLSWLFVDRVIRISVGLFVNIWIARYLGPNDFGVLNYAIAYTALFSLFVNLGLDQIVIREIVRVGGSTQYNIIGTAFGLKLIGSIVAVGGVLFSLTFSSAEYGTKVIIIILSIGFIFQSLNVIDFFFQSKVLSKYVVIARGAAFITSSLLKIYLIIYAYSVVYFAMAILLDVCLSAFFMLFVYLKTGWRVTEWQFSKKIAKTLLQSSWTLALSALLITIHMKIDQIMIGNMLNTEQVGVYSVAVSLAEFWYFIPGIIVSTLLPYFVDLRENDNKLYYLRLTKLFSLMFWMGISAGIFMLAFGESIIHVLYGRAYSDAYYALIFNIWAGIFVSQGVARGIWMISENLQRYRLYNNLIVVVLNIGLNIYLIPRAGISGAAFATLFTQFFGLWLVSFMWKPLRASTWSMIKSINPLYLVRG